MVTRLEGNSPLINNQKAVHVQNTPIPNINQSSSLFNVQTSSSDIGIKLEESGAQPLTPEQRAAKAINYQNQLDEVEYMKNNSIPQTSIRIVPKYDNGLLVSKAHYKEGQDEPILLESFDNFGRCIKRENDVLGVTTNYQYDGMFLIQEDECWKGETINIKDQNREITITSPNTHIIRRYNSSQKYTGLEPLNEREPVSEEKLDVESALEIEKKYNHSEIYDEETANNIVSSENETWQGQKCLSRFTTYCSGKTKEIVYDISQPQTTHVNPDGTLMLTSCSYSTVTEKDNKGNKIEIKFDNVNNTKQIYVNDIEMNNPNVEYEIRFDGLHKIYKNNKGYKDSIVELHDNRNEKSNGSVIEIDGENTTNYIYKRGKLIKTLYNGVIQK